MIKRGGALRRPSSILTFGKIIATKLARHSAKAGPPQYLGRTSLGGFSAPGGIEAKVALLRHEGAAGLLI